MSLVRPGTLLAKGAGRGPPHSSIGYGGYEVRVRTREKLQLAGVVLAGVISGIALGWILVQLLILR